jgi:ubiquilin
MDPAMMSQMLQNPMMQSMMQNIASNPQMLQQMIQSNPMLQNMAQQNPMLQQVLNNPQMLQAMMNPQMMQAMLNMRQSMAGMGMGAPGAMPQTPAVTGIPSPATDMATNPGAGAPPNPMFDPAMMQAAMQAMMGGGMGGGAGLGGGVPVPTDARLPEERFTVQLDQLSNMGFPDKHSNLQALQTANGDVNQAINSLLGA